MRACACLFFRGCSRMSSYVTPACAVCRMFLGTAPGTRARSLLAAYSEFNARVFAYLEPASLPVKLRRKTDKDGHTQSFLLDEQRRHGARSGRDLGEAQGQLAVVAKTVGRVPANRQGDPVQRSPPRKHATPSAESTLSQGTRRHGVATQRPCPTTLDTGARGFGSERVLGRHMSIYALDIGTSL
jgi:hypothetical protein